MGSQWVRHDWVTEHTWAQMRIVKEKEKVPLSVMCDGAGKHSKGGEFRILWEPRYWWTMNTSSHHKIIKNKGTLLLEKNKSASKSSYKLLKVQKMWL